MACKKIKATIVLEIDNAKEFKKAWKSEGYDNPEDFLNDYLSPDFVNEDFMDFDFEVKSVHFKKIKEK